MHRFFNRFHVKKLLLSQAGKADISLALDDQVSDIDLDGQTVYLVSQMLPKLSQSRKLFF